MKNGIKQWKLTYMYLASREISRGRSSDSMLRYEHAIQGKSLSRRESSVNSFHSEHQHASRFVSVKLLSVPDLRQWPSERGQISKGAALTDGPSPLSTT